MSSAGSGDIDDDRLAKAAQRIIRQYQLQQMDRSEDSGGTVRPTRAPDDLQSLRLVIDEMALAIEQMKRFVASRDELFLAVVERIERNLAKTEGRIDAMADQLVHRESRPILEIDELVERQRVATSAILEEHRQMMALTRTMLDEISVLVQK